MAVASFLPNVFCYSVSTTCIDVFCYSVSTTCIDVFCYSVSTTCIDVFCYSVSTTCIEKAASSTSLALWLGHGLSLKSLPFDPGSIKQQHRSMCVYQPIIIIAHCFCDITSSLSPCFHSVLIAYLLLRYRSM